jgi:hypothetical protein
MTIISVQNLLEKCHNKMFLRDIAFSAHCLTKTKLLIDLVHLQEERLGGRPTIATGELAATVLW